MSSCLAQQQTPTPVVVYPVENFEFAWSRAESPIQDNIYFWSVTVRRNLRYPISLTKLPHPVPSPGSFFLLEMNPKAGIDSKKQGVKKSF
jgi:hypothetical protein